MSDAGQLDKEQQNAVEAREAAIAVLAGPGSGKTRVLSFRARHLLLADRDSRALLLTFTNKAAAEMKSRAQGASPAARGRLTACTFHTFGAELLRAHGTLIGIPREFEILDEQESAALCAEVAGHRYAGLAHSWSHARLRCETPSAPVREFGDLYEAKKRSLGVVDFDDLVVHTAALLTGNAALARAYAARYPHVLIDEFQDTNAAQFAIVEALANHTKSVSIFADDDQAIYGFAGADLEHIRHFVERLRAREYPLTTNYRCRSAIVERANRLLDADPTASSRRMKAAYAGGEAMVVAFGNRDEEALWVAADIERLLAAGCPPEDISVLVRTRGRATNVFHELTRCGLPLSDWLGERYPARQRRLLRQCLSVIHPQMTARQRDHLCELFHLPPSPASDTTEFLSSRMEYPGIPELHRMSRMPGSGATVAEILVTVQASVAMVDAELGASLEDIIASVRAFEEHDSEFTFEHLLNELSLGGGTGAPAKGGGIKVATLHRTKGLQWPNVYLLGLEADHLPHWKCKSDHEIAGERRVCFVGVCRAELRLVFTWTAQYLNYVKEPSPFLREMGFE